MKWWRHSPYCWSLLIHGEPDRGEKNNDLIPNTRLWWSCLRSLNYENNLAQLNMSLSRAKAQRQAQDWSHLFNSIQMNQSPDYSSMFSKMPSVTELGQRFPKGLLRITEFNLCVSVP